MEATGSKTGLITRIESAHAQWDNALAQAGKHGVERRGVTGEWSVKDIAAHLNAWESRVVAWLEAARAGTWPAPAAWPTNLDEDATNDWIFKANRDRLLQDIAAKSRENLSRISQLLAELPEDSLTDPNRYEWLGGQSLAAAIPGNSFDHFQEHTARVLKWLEERERVDEQTALP